MARRPNFLDELYDELSKRVSAIVAQPKETVGYRDRERLGIGDRWAGDLAENLRTAKVLVPLLTPNFLADPNNRPN